MAALDVVKALAYVTRGERLLVFRQPDFPEQGIQVPGGSREPNETLEAAVLRETREEAGLEQLQVEALLGSARYELRVDVGPAHLRYFFHLSVASAPGDSWRHQEARRHAAPLVRELWWQPLSAVTLDWAMDAALPLLRQRLAR